MAHSDSRGRARLGIWPTVIGALLIADLLGIGGVVIWRWQNSGISNFSLLELGPLLVLGGVLAALITLALNHRRESSKEYLASASDLISKSYDALANEKDDLGRPKSSRVNWLTAARLLKTAEEVASHIAVDSHRRVWTETKEYWRGRFHDLIFPGSESMEGFSSDYYSDKPEDMVVYSSRGRSPLSEKSLVYLYRFIKWPQDMKDPLDMDLLFSPEEIEHMATFGPRGLGRLMQRARQIRDEKRKSKSTT